MDKAPEKGTVILLPWPFSDHTSLKVRPALVIASALGGSSDFIALMITTQYPERASPWHVCIRQDDADFSLTGLTATSYVRCDRIYTFEDCMIRDRVGRVSERIMAEVNKRLVEILSLGKTLPR